MIKEKHINKWIFFIPILGILFISIVLTFFFVQYIKDVNAKELAVYLDTEEDKIRKEVKSRVLNSIKFAENSYLSERISQKEEVKNIVDIGYEIIENIYEENQDKSKEEILKLITQKLRSLKFFNNLSGYYFIFDTRAMTIMAPHRRDLEGQNFYKINNQYATEFMNGALQLLLKKDEGYYDWKWYKPKEEIPKNKTGYLKLFKPLGIFIGSGKYNEDIQSSVKKSVQNLLNMMRFDDKGYIFAYDLEGTTIAHFKKHLIGTNRWTLRSRGRSLVKEIIKLGQEKEGGFIQYEATIDPRTSRPSDKISYVKSLKPFNWVIGHGVYNTDIIRALEVKKAQMQKRLDDTILQIIVISLAVTIISVLLMFIITISVRKIFEEYRMHLKHVNESLEHKVKERTMELEASQRKLKELVIRDPLTSLFNRRYFEEISYELLLLSRREQKPLCMAMVDIDYFKQINDNYGHDVGDEILKNLAERLRKHIRKSDVVARIGGEEFVIVFPNTTAKQADRLCNYLRKSVEELDYVSFNLSLVKFTISIGLSEYIPEKDVNYRALLKRADEALYDAKANGRNQVVVK